MPPARRVLVTGFGPFLEVTDNPSGRVARAVHGRVVRGVEVHGVELPVTYDGGPAAAVAHAEALDAEVVIGLGVDRRTPTVDVETRAYNLGVGRDIEGFEPRTLEAGGPPIVHANVDAVAFATALGARVDDDAGRYVCNAWLYKVARSLQPRRRVVFVHVPAAGLDPERLLFAIGEVFDR